MRHPLRTVLLALGGDVVLVVVFAAIGRANHQESVLPGLFETAWPFLAGLVLGWLISLAWRAPLAPLRTGLPVWAVTVAGGMALRAVSGQGVLLAFVIVASIVLLVFLVGWRAAVRVVTGFVRRRPGAIDAA